MKKEAVPGIIIMLLLSYIFVPADTHPIADSSPVLKEHPPVSRLEWISPHGELPGTYEEYIRRHPMQPARFSLPPDEHAAPIISHDISILVDEGLYDDISAQLDQFMEDIEVEGHGVAFQTVSGGTPEEIKSWIKTQYLQGSSGIIFIGDITAAWAEVSGSVFPCDLFYMDLDGAWEDDDDDGVYESHSAGSGDMGPEIYVGRIYATTLQYDTEGNMVNEYLAKTHAYRTGEMVQPWRGLEYVDEDWYDMDVALDNIYGANVTRHDYGYYTTAEDYLQQMSLGQHFVQICAHSYSGGHHFGTRPTESASYAHVYVHSPVTREAQLLLGSDDGIKVWLNGENVYTNDRYGGWHADSYRVDVTLNAGWNRLLCKVSQEGGDYRFSARFTDENRNSFEDLSYQVNNPEYYGEEAPFIRSWLLNGFHQDTSDNFWSYLSTNYLGVDESGIDPHEGDVMGGMVWSVYDSGNPYIDISEYSDDADFGACYAYARVYAAADTPCQLWMGYDDGARVWLNGEEVLYDNRYGGFEADMTKVNITLHAGENRLLVKISEWMGANGFSARFCRDDGGKVDGLTYDPAPIPISHIGTWLVNGPYLNPDRRTRLTTDYLQDEGEVSPSAHDAAPFSSWEWAVGDAYPFDLGTFFDHGGWVLSEDIQEHDPPVLFYNLFSCGPGRFTDENYLAGAYIFHTTYGLITIASSKSGSMLNFEDFTVPLGEGASIGEAFYDWFNDQAPFQQWEKEWYYGMVICGDPTLHVIQHPSLKIITPDKALYVNNHRLFPFLSPLIFGTVNVEVAVTGVEHIERVEFYIDDGQVAVDFETPYIYTWDTISFRRHRIKAVGYDASGATFSDEIFAWKFF